MLYALQDDMMDGIYFDGREMAEKFASPLGVHTV